MNLQSRIIKGIKNHTPGFAHPFLRGGYHVLTRIVYSTLHAGNKITCPFCKHSYNHFIPYNNYAAITREADIVGGKSIPNDLCPACRGGKRDRLVYC